MKLNFNSIHLFGSPNEVNFRTKESLIHGSKYDLIGRCEFIHLLRPIPINLVSTAAIQNQSVSMYRTTNTITSLATLVMQGAAAGSR